MSQRHPELESKMCQSHVQVPVPSQPEDVKNSSEPVTNKGGQETTGNPQGGWRHVVAGEMLGKH